MILYVRTIFGLQIFCKVQCAEIRDIKLKLSGILSKMKMQIDKKMYRLAYNVPKLQKIFAFLYQFA